MANGLREGLGAGVEGVAESVEATGVEGMVRGAGDFAGVAG